MSQTYTPDKECPLDGVRVLDLSRLVAGNMLTVMLADFGAEVIKVEYPGRGDTLRDWLENGIAAHWKVYGRNKKSLTLDVREAEGKALLKRLAATAAIVVESFRPGVMERLGLGPEDLWSVNPRLVYVRVTGWGQTGPYRDRPGFGSLVEGMSGFAAKNGYADRPPTLPNMALADMVAGLSGFAAVLVALREVELKGGRGQVVDLSLLEPMFAILGPDVAEYRISGRVKQRSGNRASITAPRNVYWTRDGKFVALSASIEDMARRLFSAIGRAELADDPRFRTNADRLAHAEELDAIIQDFMSSRDRDDLLAYFAAAEVTVGPVYDASEIADDPHVQGREVLVELPDPDLGRLPMHNVFPRLSASPGAIRTPAPALGQHTHALLTAIGVTEEEIAALAGKGVV